MENPTRTHIRSVRFGGSLTDENKVIVCTPCNNDKGYLTLKDLLRKLRRGGETCGKSMKTCSQEGLRRRLARALGVIPKHDKRGVDVD